MTPRQIIGGNCENFNPVHGPQYSAAIDEEATAKVSDAASSNQSPNAPGLLSETRFPISLPSNVRYASN